MASGAIQDTKRALVLPPFTQVDNFEQIFRRFYGQLSQQVQTLNNSFRQFPATVGAAAGSLTITYSSIVTPSGTIAISPYSDANYAALATPSWSTTVYIAAAGDITATSVKFTFGTASPGGGGILYVVTLR